MSCSHLKGSECAFIILHGYEALSITLREELQMFENEVFGKVSGTLRGLA